MSTEVLVLVVFLLILAGLAAWSRRETTSLSGFFLAGKKLPWWVVAFSTNATGESGWLLLGLTGMGYAVGAQAYWVVVGEVIGIWLSWTLISRRLKRLADRTDSITLPDVIAARFDDARGPGKHLLRGIAVVIIVSMVCAYVSAQMVASGKAFGTFIGLDYRTAVLLGEGPPLAGEGGTAEVAEEGPERLVVEVRARSAGVLMVQRAWLPIYRAAVDGAPAEPVPVSLYRMGVELPAGEHRVVIETDRRPLAGTLAAAAAGLLALLGLAVTGCRGRAVESGAPS